MPFPLQFENCDDDHHYHDHHSRDRVSVTGHLTFPISEGTMTQLPFKFEIEMKEKILSDILLPGPVVNYEICSGTITSGQLALIQVIESAPDATVTLNHGSPLPLIGKNSPQVGANPTPSNELSPGLIFYCNEMGGLTSIIFNSAYCMKVSCKVFGF